MKGSIAALCLSGQVLPRPRTLGAVLGYLTFLPAITVPSLPVFELAVARTFGTSFLGFLVSLLPLLFSLDMACSLYAEVPASPCRGDRCPRFRPMGQGASGAARIAAEVGACGVKMGL